MNRAEILAQLRADERIQREKVERLRKPLLQAEEQLKHLQGTIAFYEHNDGPTVASVTVELTLTGLTERIKRMTHSEAVVAIAMANEGIVRAQEAKRLMIKAGIMSPTKNSTNMTHNAILRTDMFERIGPGEFRLKKFSADDLPLSEEHNLHHVQ